jgi:hypothetical protein
MADHSNFFDYEDICFNVLLFVQDIVDIYQLSKVNQTLHSCVKILSTNMINLQFSLINFAIIKKWKFIANPKKTGKSLISYTPSHQIFFNALNGDTICQKFCCVFFPKTKTLEIYQIHVTSKTVWDGKKIRHEYVKGGKIEGCITESGLQEYSDIPNVYYLESIIFPKGWLFHKLNANYTEFHPYLLKFNNYCLMQINVGQYDAVRVIKFDERGVHFLFHKYYYQPPKILLKKLRTCSHKLTEKFYYGLFDFKKFSMLARSKYVSDVTDSSNPKFCDILIESKKKSNRYFIKSTRHHSLIPLKNSTKTPKIINSVQIF